MNSYIPTLEELNTAIERKDFGEWLHTVTPQYIWEWQHLIFIREQLDRVTRGECDRLMLFVPPRHGKSELTTIHYSTWMIERNPEMRVIIGAYNQTLANKFARKARKIARERIELDTARTAVEDWETLQGGGMRAVGVGGGVTGQGGNLIVIDDPVKNRQEANSEVYRNKVWDWYTDDLYTRLEPDAKMILIMTRWHEDDLAGKILASEDAPSWEVIKLPAQAEENDQLGRKVGEALCPDRYNVDKLKRIKQVLGNSYYALYQQRPTAPEGGMFKRQWFDVIGQVPKDATRVRYWDKAGTSGGGDYTAGALLARDSEGVFYVENIIRGQWSALDRERIIKNTAEIDGKGITIWIEQEPGSGGKESAERTLRMLAGWNAHKETVTGDKATRADPLAAQLEARNVKLKRGNWNAGYIDRFTSFPFATNDDEVDATSGAFNKLADCGPLVLFGV